MVYRKNYKYIILLSCNTRDARTMQVWCHVCDGIISQKPGS